MELVDGGTVRDECDRGEGGWSEEQVCRRVRLLLKPLELLHNMGVSHRDVTPPNVFVGNRKVLKLGDFGITKAQLKPSGVYADVLNPAFAPKDLGTWWRPADDVYQVGLLMATLVAGEEFYTGVKKPEINEITGTGKLREAIKAAISVKARRPQTATGVGCPALLMLESKHRIAQKRVARTQGRRWPPMLGSPCSSGPVRLAR